jgi:hypothetical protein
MAKARVYGQAGGYVSNKRRDLRYIKKTARNRERAMPSLVAGRERTTDRGEKPKE